MRCLLASLLTQVSIGAALADQVTDVDVDGLRSLPYASSSPTEEIRSGVVLHDAERTCPGLRLITIQALSRADLIDADGTVVHSWRLQRSGLWEHAELLANGGLIVIGTDASAGVDCVPAIPDSARYVARLDRDSNVVWKRRINAHHDAEIRPDGELAVLTFERRRIPGIHPDLDTRDDGITILDPDTGETLESWGFLDAVAGSEDVFPPQTGAINDLGGAPWVDLFHANSLEWIRETHLFGTHSLYAAGHVLACFRNQDRVAIFDAEARRVLWAWGQGELSGPHDAQLLPGGNILLFDNGLERGWSRAVEVDPRRDRIVWEWRTDPPESFFTASKGSVQRLPNGNTLLAESDRGHVVEVGGDGSVVWHFVNPEREVANRPLAFVRAAWIGAERLQSYISGR
jgi:hypothetical protein